MPFPKYEEIMLSAPVQTETAPANESGWWDQFMKMVDTPLVHHVPKLKKALDVIAQPELSDVTPSRMVGKESEGNPLGMAMPGEAKPFTQTQAFLTGAAEGLTKPNVIADAITSIIPGAKQVKAGLRFAKDAPEYIAAAKKGFEYGGKPAAILSNLLLGAEGLGIAAEGVTGERTPLEGALGGLQALGGGAGAYFGRIARQANAVKPPSSIPPPSVVGPSNLTDKAAEAIELAHPIPSGGRGRPNDPISPIPQKLQTVIEQHLGMPDDPTVKLSKSAPLTLEKETAEMARLQQDLGDNIPVDMTHDQFTKAQGKALEENAALDYDKAITGQAKAVDPSVQNALEEFYGIQGDPSSRNFIGKDVPFETSFKEAERLKADLADNIPVDLSHDEFSKTQTSALEENMEFDVVEAAKKNLPEGSVLLPPSVSRSASSKQGGVTESMREKYGVPEPKEGSGSGGGNSGGGTGGGGGTTPTQQGAVRTPDKALSPAVLKSLKANPDFFKRLRALGETVHFEGPNAKEEGMAAAQRLGVDVYEISPGRFRLIPDPSVKPTYDTTTPLESLGKGPDTPSAEVPPVEPPPVDPPPAGGTPVGKGKSPRKPRGPSGMRIGGVHPSVVGAMPPPAVDAIPSAVDLVESGVPPQTVELIERLRAEGQPANIASVRPEGPMPVGSAEDPARIAAAKALQEADNAPLPDVTPVPAPVTPKTGIIAPPVVDTSQMTEKQLFNFYRKQAPNADMAFNIRNASPELRAKAQALTPTKQNATTVAGWRRAELQALEMAADEPQIGSERWQEMWDRLKQASEEADAVPPVVDDVVEGVADVAPTTQAADVVDPTVRSEPVTDSVTLQEPSSDVDEVMSATGVTSGQRPYTPGQTVASPVEGAIFMKNPGENKPKWTTSEFGQPLGPNRNVGRPKNNPESGAESLELALRSGLGAAGAIGGSLYAEQNDMNPITGMVVGAAAGAVAPSAFTGLIKAAQASGNAAEMSAAGQKMKDVISKGVAIIPDVIRANLLFNIPNLPINVWVGPYGSAVMGSIEALAHGDMRGATALGKLANLPGFFKRWTVNLKEAGSKLEQAHSRDEISNALEDVHPLIKHTVSGPGRFMTAGDMAARDILLEAGFSLDEARAFTLTDEPEMPLPRGIRNFMRGAQTEGGIKSTAARVMLPFHKTILNQAEASLERFPIAGMWANGAFESIGFKGAKDPLKRTPAGLQAAQQILGGGIMYGMYETGYNTPIDPVGTPILMKIISNAGGQYGMLAAAAFAAGQAAGAGDPQSLGDFLTTLTRNVPLPTNRPIAETADILDAGVGMITGEGDPLPTSLDELRARAEELPTSIYPQAFRAEDVKEKLRATPGIKSLMSEEVVDEPLYYYP